MNEISLQNCCSLPQKWRLKIISVHIERDNLQCWHTQTCFSFCGLRASSMVSAAPQALSCSRHPGKYPFCQDLAKVHVTNGCKLEFMPVRTSVSEGCNYILLAPAGSVSQLFNPCQKGMLDLYSTDTLPDLLCKIMCHREYISVTWQGKLQGKLFSPKLPKICA